MNPKVTPKVEKCSTDRKKYQIRRGRKKESEKGNLKGEQSIEQFLIASKGKKILTPKRKKSEEENSK